MIRPSIIKCKCKNTVGEYLGLIKTDGKEFYLHKCTKCKAQIKVPKEDGLNYA